MTTTSILANVWLFALVIAKTSLLTGIGPGLVLLAIFVRCPFPFCVLREFHNDDHDVRVPIERYVPFREQIELFKVSGGGQLAQHRVRVLDSILHGEAREERRPS